MPITYPFLDRVRERLDSLDGKPLTWLATELGKTPRTFYNITDFSKMALADIEKVSTLLEMNFMEDYNRWLLENDQPPLSVLNEPAGHYEPKINRVTVSLKISAPEQVAEDNLSKMISEVRQAADKLGFKLD